MDVAVISDVHLGTYGCHADELLRYLKSIRPQVLVLNGDIIDIWQFSKNYWPPAHMRVVRYVLGLLAKGTRVYYLTGNHDELLRRFAEAQLGNLTLANKLVLELPTGKAWFFHGDVFDVTMRHARWLARLGSHGYDLLILLNRFVNAGLARLGRPRVALSKAVKDRVKGAVSLIGDFEQTAASLAAERGYRYVVCGHIHQPAHRPVLTNRGEVEYLNSGDWVENLTALEYTAAAGWQLYAYAADPLMQQPAAPEADEPDEPDPTAATLLAGLQAELHATTLTPA